MPTENRLPRPMRPLQRLYNYLSRGFVAASYPLRGIYYFLRHPAFYPLFVGRLLPLSIISTLVYTILFTFTFLPQYAFLALFHGWAVWLNAVVLVLGEGLVIIQGLFEGFFVDECRVDIFDATLLNEHLEDLVAPHRLLFPDAPNSVKKLGKPTTAAAYQPWSLIQIVELIFFLPLNLIPYVGTPAFILITGARLGTFAHYRWFELRGLTKKEQKQEIRTRMWEYTWFGTVAMLLQLVPILSFFFLLTSTAGSALWTVKLEKQMRAPTAAPGEEAAETPEIHPDGPPPPYVDYPV
ncbi:Uu.00g135460.m01.CDS01 [Anthostomella pinea]|uniref:Uu.00g135460.m01.CDS01 n=1 Tax=Anthostomella pinea TaxID=933095 RepID=A0AAI8YII0_9PEZI|nr:Uu.00g135460.m01.CDS01 [Anthostomella pinea]